MSRLDVARARTSESQPLHLPISKVQGGDLHTLNGAAEKDHEQDGLSPLDDRRPGMKGLAFAAVQARKLLRVAAPCGYAEQAVLRSRHTEDDLIILPPACTFDKAIHFRHHHRRAAENRDPVQAIAARNVHKADPLAIR